jgi:mannose-1-phosphate guanylyltransferase/mannose-1-phosphate guanylyltransferase/phosphomannomutase
MVLAAGMGSRLYPLTRQLPKPMLPFVNRPVMDHILRLLTKHGIRDVVANVHYLPEHVISHFGDRSQYPMRTRFVHEPKLSGDAGGVRACRQFLNGTFLVVMGDLITDMDLGYVIRQHQTKGALATIALKPVQQVERFGVAVLDTNGLVTGFQEKPKAHEAQSNLASTGVYVFEPDIFEYIGVESEVGFGRHVFPRLIEAGLPLLGVTVPSYWSDIGTIDQYKRTTADALHGLIDVDIPGARFGDRWIGEGTEFGRRCSIEGAVVFGKLNVISCGKRKLSRPG